MTGIHHVTAISGKAARNLDFYTHVLGLRFVKKTVNFDETHEALEKRFGERVLPFKDPDGLIFAVVCAAGPEGKPAWHTSDIPTEHAIRGFHGVTLLLEGAS